MKTHRPLVLVVIFYASGILMSALGEVPFRILFFLTVLSLILTLITFKKENISRILLFLFFLCLGAFTFAKSQWVSENDLSSIVHFYRHKPITLKGVIVSDVQKGNFFQGKKTTFEFETKSVKTPWGWKEQSGKILVNIFRDADVFYGNEIILEGKLHKPFNFASDGHFSYPEYLENQGIRWILSVKREGRSEILHREKGSPFYFWLLRLKSELKKILQSNLSANEAGLMQGFLLGDRSQIPKHIRELFVRTGTAHILAISGMNVGFVAAFIFVFLRLVPIGRIAQTVITVGLLIVYALLTGAMPSVVRATIMAVVFLLSYIFDKESDGINSLCLAAFLILLVNPRDLFHVGFQLSFICVLFILLLYPAFLKFFEKIFTPTPNKTRTLILQSLSISLAAWIGVAGLIAYYFQIITPVTILANLIVVPLSSLIIYVGFGLLLAGSCYPAAAFIFANTIKFILNFMVGCIYLFDKLPGAYFYLRDVTLTGISLYYGLLCLVFYVLWLRFVSKFRSKELQMPL